MESNKTAKKTAKVGAKPVASVSEKAAVDSKPTAKSAKTLDARRTATSAVRAQESSSKSDKISSPKQTSHRHSKVTAPAAPVVEEVVANVVVPVNAPVNQEDVARLAYKFWEERNYAHGFAEEDWHRAVTTLSAAG